MCAHYESPNDKALLKKHFGIDLPSELARRDVWPGYLSTFVRRHPQADVGDAAVLAHGGQVGRCRRGQAHSHGVAGAELVEHLPMDALQPVVALRACDTFAEADDAVGPGSGGRRGEQHTGGRCEQSENKKTKAKNTHGDTPGSSPLAVTIS